VLENATSKLHRKGLDMVCANDVSDDKTGFGSDLNQLILITAEQPETLELAPKSQQAAIIVKKITDMLTAK